MRSGDRQDCPFFQAPASRRFRCGPFGRVGAASGTIGNVLEWYDFSIYEASARRWQMMRFAAHAEL